MSNSYKTTCGSCGGNNFYVTRHNNLGYCFNCGYTRREGKAEPLKRADNIGGIRALYTEITNYYHSCLDSEHRLYLNSRGITDASIEKYRIGFVPNDTHILYRDDYSIDSGIARADGTPFLANRIVFPYWAGNTVTDLRGRVFGIEDERKYLSPYNNAFYRGADYPYAYDELLKHDTLVLAEGELKTVASNMAGIPAVGVPGILSLRPQLKQRDNQTFVVCFDTQVEHWFDVVRAIQRLAKKFQNLLVATLPLMNRTKMDIDDYIRDYGVSAYKDVISRAISYDSWLSLVRV